MSRHPFSSLFSALAVATVFGAPAFAVDLSAQSTVLEEGRPVRGTIAAGDTARYTVDVGEDYWVFLEVDQIDVDVSVRVLRPDGNQLSRSNGPGRGGERLAGRLADAGVYTIEVIPADKQAGDYAIILHSAEPVATDPEKLADQLMARFDGDDSPGAAIQVWRDGRTVFTRTYGMANLAYGLPFEPNTRTNIGSTSKQFTAFAIMLQADRGALSLDDDIRDHIPELPEFEEVVTVRHIITHTSGLREFLNLLAMTGRRFDHGDWVDRSELIDIVQRQPALQNSPGAEWNYNNTAFGLAATIVERTSGQDFHVFMQENVFGPLGMTRTMVRPSIRHIVPDMSEGYTPGPDGFMQIGDLGGAVGAGGIYTTLADLQTWVENYADPRVGSDEIFDEMMTSYVLTDGEETGYGYGLSIDEQRGLKRVHHGGADIAHRSMLVYYPEINAGITVQSNHALFNSGIAFQLAGAFFADAMESEEDETASAETDFDSDAYDPEDFDDFVGRYALDESPSFILTFTREDETLHTQATGQQRLEIVPTSDSTFALNGVEASVTFHRDEDGEVDGATLHQNGDHHATRLSDDDAAWEPTAEDLADYAGRYFSVELETFYRLVVEEGELTLHHRRLDEASLSAGEEDSFSGGGFTFSFERDRNGEVIGFYLSNGRTRDVRFDRVR
jgi:CubicO group peptidase (beta-lactamase class C family)